MEQNEVNVLKRLFSRYPKIFINSAITSFLNSLTISFLFVFNKISNIKAGEYPEEPMDIRIERLNEAMPGIIIISIIIGLLIMTGLFILHLILGLRRANNIYLFHEIKLYLKEKKASKKDCQ